MQAGWHGNFITQTQFDPTRTPGNVTFSISSSLRFEGNIFTHLGAVGLNLDSGSQGNAIIGNAFRDISSTAIQIGDVSQASRLTTDVAKQNRSNTISNNYITDVAVEYRSAVGIFVGYSWGASLEHNEVSNLPYTGISIGWGWGYRPDGSRTGCNDSFAGNNQIVANRVHDVMRVLIDGGDIYTLGGQFGSHVTENFISASPRAIGLYHDQGTCYYTDEDNVFANTWQWTSMWEWTIQNNTIFHNFVDVDVASCGGAPGPASTVCNSPERNNVVFDNFATGGVWPALAVSTMNQAGLEPAYAGLASPVCGDATCNAGETAASCPKDCQ
jgi:hypothetical protein